MSLWDGAKESAAKAGEAAMIAGQKTMLQGEIMLLDREINNRKRAFGVELYDHVQIFSTRAEFYSSDDLLTATLRPPLLKAQREIAALEIKRGKFREDISQAEIARKGAFPAPADTWYEKMMNAGKVARMAGNEAKLSAELSMVEVQMRDYKETFGLELFAALTDLEDSRGWLPTDREIRSLYDNARRDIEKAEEKRKKKEQEVVDLGRVGNNNGSYLVPDPAASTQAPPPPPGKGGGHGSSVASTQAPPPPGSGGGHGSSVSSLSAPPPPGKGGGYGSSVPMPSAPATNLGGGYGSSVPVAPAPATSLGVYASSTANTAPAYDFGGGDGGGLSSTNQTAAAFYDDDDDYAATPPVATPVIAAAPIAAAPAPAAPNNSSFSFISPESDPFAGLSTGGSMLGGGNNNNTLGTQAPSTTTSANGVGVMNDNSNAGANISGIFAGITDPPSSSTTTGQTSAANSGTSNFGDRIGGAIMKASLNNPKAAANALSAASSFSSSFKF